MSFHYSPLIVTDGLVFAVDAANKKSYPGSGTTWKDLSKNGNDGTLTNGPTFDSGSGGSIVFDGTNDYIHFGNVDELNFGTGSFSLSIWFRYDGVLSTSDNYDRAGLISKSNTAGGNPLGYQLVLRDNSSVYGGILLRVGDGTTDAGFISGDNVRDILLDGNFHNITAVFDYGNVAFTTLDNVKYNETDISSFTGNITNTSNFNIGTWTTTADSFEGIISNTFIYNKALSDNEITQNYNALKGRFGLS